MARVDAIEPDFDGDAPCAEVERRRYRCCGRYGARCTAPFTAEPVEQGAASQRNARREERGKRHTLANGGEHPPDFRVVARVIRARPTIGLAAAAAEVRHDPPPTYPRKLAHQRQRVVRGRVPFESMKEH